MGSVLQLRASSGAHDNRACSARHGLKFERPKPLEACHLLVYEYTFNPSGEGVFSWGYPVGFLVGSVLVYSVYSGVFLIHEALWVKSRGS